MAHGGGTRSLAQTAAKESLDMEALLAGIDEYGDNHPAYHEDDPVDLCTAFSDGCPETISDARKVSRTGTRTGGRHEHGYIPYSGLVLD